MSSIWNNRISVSVFGEPDGNAVGINIDCLPVGEYIDIEEIEKFFMRRFPKACSDGTEKVTSPRIISGLSGGRTTGGVLCVLLSNGSAKTSQRMEMPKNIRSGHADYTGSARYRGFNFLSDLGEFTDRIISPLCFAGAVCGQILERRGIYTSAHVLSLHNIKDNPFDYVRVKRDSALSVRNKDFPVINDSKGWLMLEDMQEAEKSDEALGGVVECISINVPAGIGSPVFNGLHNSIANLVFSIPGVSGIEFGAGFSSARMIGSQNEDEFYINEHGHAVTATNNHGGIIGGISSGMPIVVKVSLKPMRTENVPSIVPSSIPCIESAVNIALLSHMIDYPDFC